jgi:hypothetical protein
MQVPENKKARRACQLARWAPPHEHRQEGKPACPRTGGLSRSSPTGVRPSALRGEWGLWVAPEASADGSIFPRFPGVSPASRQGTSASLSRLVSAETHTLISRIRLSLPRTSCDTSRSAAGSQAGRTRSRRRAPTRVHHQVGGELRLPPPILRSLQYSSRVLTNRIGAAAEGCPSLPPADSAHCAAALRVPARPQPS